MSWSTRMELDLFPLVPVPPPKPVHKGQGSSTKKIRETFPEPFRIKRSYTHAFLGPFTQREKLVQFNYYNTTNLPRVGPSTESPDNREIHSFPLKNLNPGAADRACILGTDQHEFKSKHWPNSSAGVRSQASSYFRKEGCGRDWNMSDGNTILTDLRGSCRGVFTLWKLTELQSHLYTRGFPGGTTGKESTCQCRRHKRYGFNPWVGKIPWSRKWQPTPVFLPGKFHGQRSLEGYKGAGHDWMTEHIHPFTSLNFHHFPSQGKKNLYPIEFS